MQINDIVKKIEVDNISYLLTKFLNPEEVTELKHKKIMDKAIFTFGGFNDSERMRVIIQDDTFGEPSLDDFEIATLKITLPKVDQSITHRNILGYLMSLGIKREVLGDILIRENNYYLFIIKDMVNFMISNVTKINKYLVTPEIVDFKKVDFEIKKEDKEITISSNRLDAIIAKTYNLSRETAQNLINRGLVQINHHIELKLEKPLKDSDLVSVRGYGKFEYLGETRHTKKDRIVAIVSIYK